MVYKSYLTEKQKLKKIVDRSNSIESAINNDLGKIEIRIKPYDNLKKVVIITLADNEFLNTDGDGGSIFVNGGAEYNLVFPNMSEQMTNMVRITPIFRVEDGFKGQQLFYSTNSTFHIWTKKGTDMHLFLHLEASVSGVINSSFISDIPVFFDLNLYLVNDYNNFITQTIGK